MADKQSPKKGRQPLTPHRKEQSRREFLRSSVLFVGVTSASLLGFLPVVRGTSIRLRPPGALKTPDDEREFFSACIKCGQCVQVCPVQAIKLADLDDGFGVGIPYIDPRQQACDFSCDGLLCVRACPTGALRHELESLADVRMGFAHLARPDACLAVQGKGFRGQARGADFKGLLRYTEFHRQHPTPVADHSYDLEICDLCVRLCPIEIRIKQCRMKGWSRKWSSSTSRQDDAECPQKHAITLDLLQMRTGEAWLQPTIRKGCVGCGVCEMICPVEGSAILVNLEKNADMRIDRCAGEQSASCKTTKSSKRG